MVYEEKGTETVTEILNMLTRGPIQKKPPDLLGEKLNIETDELTRNCF